MVLLLLSVTAVIIILGTLFGLPIPLLLIVLGIVGFFFKGLQGVLIMIVGGYILSLMIGLAASFYHQGLVPKKERKRVAKSFLEEYSELVAVGDNLGEKQVYVEEQIERIFKKSASSTSSWRPMKSLNIDSLTSAGESLINEEDDKKIKEFLDKLLNHIILEMYTPK